ncbi:MAG: hypothetical protein ACYCWW_04860, partial [Deltaproteobacteria bacterium]
MPASTGPAEKDRTATPSAEALLRAALERLVLLECRGAEGATAPTAPRDPDGLRAGLAHAEERATAAEAKLDLLFGRLLAAERVRAGLADDSGADGEVDLAGFIAELRSELADVQRARDLAQQKNATLAAELRRAQSVSRPRGAVEWANRLAREGLLFSPGATLEELGPALAQGSAAERLLLAGVLRDLDGGDPALQDAACR